MIFAQEWIAKWLRNNCAMILNQDGQIRAKTDTMAVRGTAKGELRRGNCKRGTAKRELQKGKSVNDNRWK